MAADVAREWLIDANLLVLGAFDAADYHRLLELVSDRDNVCVTPNTLTEASNLIGQHGEPERSHCFDTLAQLIENSREVVVRSATAVRNRCFLQIRTTASLKLVHQHRTSSSPSAGCRVAAWDWKLQPSVRHQVRPSRGQATTAG